MNVTIKEGRATYSNDGNHVVDLGIIEIGSRPKITIEFSAEKIKNFKSEPACGCTITNPKIIDEQTVNLSITYTATSQSRPFSKTIKLSYREDGKQKNELLKIKGNIL